jgi:hypothetical protein
MKCNIDKKATPMAFNVATLPSYTQRAKNRLQQGEVVYLTDIDEYRIWQGEEWIALPKTVNTENSNITMTAYDLNKQLMSQMPILEDWTQAEATINEYATGNKDFMLLCKDISYYTIFQQTNSNFINFETLGEAVLTCAEDIGKIVSVDFMEETNTIEIWVRTPENDNLCMCFFECSSFIVTYGRP